MAIWLEIRCDVQKDGSTADGSPSCHSTGKMSGSSGVLGETASGAMRDIRRISLNNGWKRRRISGLIQWVCPACDEFLKRS